MSFDFDTPIDRRGTASEKWDRYEGRDILPMWVADMDFRSPPEVVDALQRRVAHGIFGYSHPTAGLNASLVARLSCYYDWPVDPSWIAWVPGVNVAMNLACRAVGQPGDEALVLTPIYPPFLRVPELAERTVRTVPLARSGPGGTRWEIDFEALEAAVTSRTRLLLLCSPHNPVGRAWTPPELEKVAAFALRHGLVVVSDEIHCGLLLNGSRHLPLARLGDEVAARTVTLLAPSKTYNVPGLACSLAVIPDAALRGRFLAAKRGLVPDVNLLGTIAAEAAWLHGEPWRAACISYLRANRDALAQALATHAPEIVMAPVEATYLAWLDVSALGLRHPQRHFEEHGLGLNDGRDFGAPGFVRLNFGCPRSTLEEGIRRFLRGVEAARAGHEAAGEARA